MHGDTHWMDTENTWHRRSRPEQRFYRPSPTRRLVPLRRMIMDEAIALRGGRQVTTDLYALGIEPTNSFLRARSHAEGRGWTVGRKFSDPYSSPDPTPRPGWSRLCDRVASGRAQGVIVIGQSDITPDDSEFEITLHWFREHGAFVDFVLAPRPLPAQTPSNEHQAPLAHP